MLPQITKIRTLSLPDELKEKAVNIFLVLAANFPKAPFEISQAEDTEGKDLIIIGFKFNDKKVKFVSIAVGKDDLYYTISGKVKSLRNFIAKRLL